MTPGASFRFDETALMAKRSTAAACIAFTVSAWTLTLFLAFDCTASEIRTFSSRETWTYHGEVEETPLLGSGPYCRYFDSRFVCAHGAGHVNFNEGWRRLDDGSWALDEVGWRYDGTFVNGEMHGYGTYETPDFVYVGGMKRGKFDGHGVLTCSYGRRLEGTFVDGKMFGQFKIAPETERYGTTQQFSGVPVDWDGPCGVELK